MPSSFSLIHPAWSDAAERAVRRDAELFLLRSGSRLIRILGHLEGEDGLASGYAFRDIVLDQEMPPSVWPVADVLDVLASADPGFQDRTALPVAALSGLLVRIDAHEGGFHTDSADPAPARLRRAA